MIRTIARISIALALFAPFGCGGDEDVSDDVNSPSEGAMIVNDNPSTPTIDVPATDVDEAAKAPE